MDYTCLYPSWWAYMGQIPASSCLLYVLTERPLCFLPYLYKCNFKAHIMISSFHSSLFLTKTATGLLSIWWFPFLLSINLSLVFHSQFQQAGPCAEPPRWHFASTEIASLVLTQLPPNVQPGCKVLYFLLLPTGRVMDRETCSSQRYPLLRGIEVSLDTSWDAKMFVCFFFIITTSFKESYIWIWMYFCHNMIMMGSRPPNTLHYFHGECDCFKVGCYFQFSPLQLGLPHGLRQNRESDLKTSCQDCSYLRIRHLRPGMIMPEFFQFMTLCPSKLNKLIWRMLPHSHKMT